MRIARQWSNHLTPAIVAESLEWCATNRIDCLYFLGAADDPQTQVLANVHGFQLVDIRITLERRIKPDEEFGASDSVRTVRDLDLGALKTIARTAHVDSRFFFDSHFPEERCEALYEAWIERSCSGWADAVFVAQADGSPAGYCTCHLGENGCGSIGLVGMAARDRGRGLGREMLNSALGYFRAHAALRVQVVTQGRNRGAQRFYQRSGFLTESVLLFYHNWLSVRPDN
jgi:ribosomal protein S18 acetylase RimI-like enzyme